MEGQKEKSNAVGCVLGTIAILVIAAFLGGLIKFVECIIDKL